MKNLDKAAYHENMEKGETIPYFKNKIDHHSDKRYFPLKIDDETQLFHFQIFNNACIRELHK